MDIDYSALASRVASFSDVLGCIILSSDGLVLGTFPPADGDGDGIKAAWLRFASIGNPERGFLKVDDQLWAYVNSGPFAAFAVAEGGTRPGVLLDHLEQTLMVAGESRDNLPAARPPGRVDLVAGTKPRAVVAEPTLDELLGSTNGSTGNGHEPPQEARPLPPIQPIERADTPIFERIRTHMIEPDYVPLAAALGRSVPQPIAPPLEPLPVAAPMVAPFDEPAHEPVDGSFEESVEEAIDGSFEETVAEPVDAAFEEPFEDPIDGSFDEPVAEPIDGSFERPDERSDGSFDGSADEPIEPRFEPSGVLLEASADPAGGQMDTLVDDPAAGLVDQPMDPPAEEQIDGQARDLDMGASEMHAEHPTGGAEGEPDTGSGPEQPEELEIDRVALAREFAGLLQEDRRNDEDNA